MAVFTNDNNFTVESGGVVFGGSVTHKNDVFEDFSDISEWTIINPLKGDTDITTNPGNLTIVALAPDSIMTTSEFTLPGIQKISAISGDFDLSFEFPFFGGDENFENIMIGVFEDLNTWVQVTGAAGNALLTAFQIRTAVGVVTGLSVSGHQTSFFLRLERTGDNFSGFYKLLSGDAWTSIGNKTQAFTDGHIFIGIQKLVAGPGLTVQTEEILDESSVGSSVVFTIHENGQVFLDAGAGNGWNRASFVEAVSANADITSVEVYTSNNSLDIPGYTPHVDMNAFRASGSTAHQFMWLRVTMGHTDSLAASFDEMNAQVFVIPVPPPPITPEPATFDRGIRIPACTTADEIRRTFQRIIPMMDSLSSSAQDTAINVIENSVQVTANGENVVLDSLDLRLTVIIDGEILVANGETIVIP